jgi:hypothetical protein
VRLRSHTRSRRRRRGRAKKDRARLPALRRALSRQHPPAPRAPLPTPPPDSKPPTLEITGAGTVLVYAPADAATAKAAFPEMNATDNFEAEKVGTTQTRNHSGMF